MLNKIRNQLTLWYSLGILISIFFLLSLFYFSTAFVFYNQVDQALKTHVDSLVASLEKDQKIAGCGCLSPNSTLLLGVLQMPGMPTAIFDENGKVIKASVDWNLVSSAQQSYRFFQAPIKNNGQIIGSIVMGHPVDSFLKTRQILLFFLILLVFLILLPVVLLGRFLAQKTLAKEKQFLTDLTHSLKTPLAVLQSQIENSKLVKLGQFDQSSLLSQVSKLSSLINETLASNYLASDQKNAPTDLTALLQELCEITQALGLEKKISLVKKLPQKPFWIKGNKQNLAKALLAVLENAVYYGKTRGKIIVSLKKDNNQAIVTIADNGAGIDKEDLPRVFDRFYRGKNHKNDGHGLGLSIAKNILEELGGEISLKSKPNKNTTATIILPTS